MKKTSPLVWILAGVLGLMILAGIAVVAGGFFLARKVQQATANPALATAKILAAANPDIEIVSSDDDKGTVTFKEKSSGKVLTVDFDQIKEGKLTFEQDGERVSFNAGSDSKLPDWLPIYPGSSTEGGLQVQGGKGSGSVIRFTTKDPIEKVAKFYEETLKHSGLTTNVNTLTHDGKNSGAVIASESADKKRTAVVTISASEDSNSVTVTYSGKR